MLYLEYSVSIANPISRCN